MASGTRASGWWVTGEGILNVPQASSSDTLPAWLMTALEAAARAPSGHNSQPWRFTWNRNALHIGWERCRELPAGDRNGRYLLTSLGSAAESLMLAAASQGHEGRLTSLLDWNTRTAGYIQFCDSPASASAVRLSSVLPQRKTTRLPFQRTMPDDVHLGGLRRAADRSGLQLHLTSDRERIQLLASTIGEGTARNLADPEVSSEFRRWLRFPGDAALDGLTVAALELNGLEALATRILVRPGVLSRGRHIGLTGRMARTQERLAFATPLFGLLTGPDGDDEAMLQAGRGMLRVWLEASLLGLRLHPMTAGIDYPDTSIATLQAFGATLREHPILCFRLGYGPPGSWARKRRARDIVEVV